MATVVGGNASALPGEAEPEPVVSVVIPTLNRCRSLMETIESVRAQDIEHPIEIVVIDNCSTDDTEAVLTGPGYGDVRYIRHAERIGRVANFNVAYRSARGELVSILYDDEVMFQGNLRAKAEILLDNPDVIAACSSVTPRDPVSRELRPGVAIRPTVTIEDRPTYLRRAFDFTTGGLPPLMVRRSVFDTLSLDERDDPLDDNAFTLNVSRLGRMASLPPGYISDTAEVGEAVGNGILEALTSRAEPDRKVHVPGLWLYWCQYRLRIDHLLRSDDLSRRDRRVLTAKARRALRVGIWKAIYFRVVACQRPVPLVASVLFRAAALSPRLLVPPVWSFVRWRTGESEAPIPPYAHTPGPALTGADTAATR